MSPDVQRDPKVLARDARRYRAILRELVLVAQSERDSLFAGMAGGEEHRLLRLYSAVDRAERAGWPGKDGMRAKRSGR